MKKALSIIGIISILLIAFINYSITHNKEKAMSLSGESEELQIEPVMGALNEIDAEVKEININSNGKISDTYETLDNLKVIGENILKTFDSEAILKYSNETENMIESNLDGCYIMTIHDEIDYKQVIINGKDRSNKNITIILYSFKDKEYKVEETDLAIDILYYGKDTILKTLKSNIVDIYSNHKSVADITTCYTGTINGKLNSDVKLDKIEKVIDLVDGKIVEKHIDDALVSITAYSEILGRYIYSAENKINLNIAINYNEIEDKTYIWVGTPIITIGY